jgi:hypothetical protein
LKGFGRSLRIEHEDKNLELVVEYFELPRNPSRPSKRATGKPQTKLVLLRQQNELGAWRTG